MQQKAPPYILTSGKVNDGIGNTSGLQKGGSPSVSLPFRTSFEPILPVGSRLFSPTSHILLRNYLGIITASYLVDFYRRHRREDRRVSQL